MLASMNFGHPIVVALVGYLIGSIPLANFLAHRAGAPDLREVGDKNPGFWNAKAHLDRRSATLVFIGDVLKGALPVAIALMVGLEWWQSYLVGLAAIAGHAWPLFARFRGGKGVLTWVGAQSILSPLPVACAVSALVLAWLVRRNFTHAVRFAVILFPFIQIVIEGAWRTAMTGVLMTLVGLRFAQR
jgi:glycerol-3-phosphate acyltransferase PlsY